MLNSKITRFRGYQLGQAGSSFSYFDGEKFTLIEGMATQMSQPNLLDELGKCGKEYIDNLHITSWDADHCSVTGLPWILDKLRPKKIEYPGYEPHTDCGEKCLNMILDYQSMPRESRIKIEVVRVDPPYVKSLNPAQGLGYRDIIYHPKMKYEKSNDNSSVKFFRTGMFNVLSLGDVEDKNIGSYLRECKILCRETDVMILAHHGSENGITTKALLERMKPRVAICGSNYGNMYEHPSESIKNLLYEQGVQLVTTKTGDVIIESLEPHSVKYKVTNLKTNSTDISSERVHEAKKYSLLSRNADSVRNMYRPGPRGPRRQGR